MPLENSKEQKLSEAEALEWVTKITDLIMKTNENHNIPSIRHIPLGEPENFGNRLGCLLFRLLEDFDVIEEPKTNIKQEVIDIIEALCDDEKITKEAKELLSEYNIHKLNRSCPVPLAAMFIFEASVNVKTKKKV